MCACDHLSSHGGGPEHLFQLTRTAGAHISCVIACPDEPPYATRFKCLENVCRMVWIPHRRLSVSAIDKLHKIIKTQKIDVIHSHGKGAGVYSRILAVLTGLPTIHTFHGVVRGEYSPVQKQIYAWISRFWPEYAIYYLRIEQRETSTNRYYRDSREKYALFQTGFRWARCH